MTFSFNKCKSILKYDGNIYNNYNKDRNVIVICDNDIVSHNFDDETFKTVVLILSGSNFNRYFFHNYISKSLQNEKTILIPREINAPCFNHNSQRFIKDFVDIKLIGHGGFGRVYMAKHKTDLYLYAIKKVIFKRKNLNKDNYQRMLTEFRILATLNHPNVVRYHTAWLEIEANCVENDVENDSGSSELHDSRSFPKSDSLIAFGSLSQDIITDENINCSQISWNTNHNTSSEYNPYKLRAVSSEFSQRSSSQNSSHKRAGNGGVQIISKTNSMISDKLVLYIQMELCNSNLHNWLQIRNKLPGDLTPEDRKITRSLARQLLSAVNYIHSNNVVHRDIKPANVLLMEHARGITCDLQLKIGDFGLAKSLTISEGISSNQRLSANVGTSFYTAPEVYSNHRNHVEYNHKCDLYSVGIILLELMLKFSTIAELSYNIREIKEGDRNGNLSLSWPIESLHVMNLLSSDSNKRPSPGFILYKTLSFKESTVENRTFEQLIQENNTLRNKVKELEKELVRLQKIIRK